MEKGPNRKPTCHRMKAGGWGWMMGVLLLSGAGVTFAQTPPGVKVSVAVDKSAYALGTDPIKVAVTLENISGGEVLASDG